MVDNYDSFVYNLVQYVGEQGAKPIIFRNDEITLRDAKALKPDRVIISPGPGSPTLDRYFGVSTQIIREMGREVPILGVCLGHQGIIHCYGGEIRRAKKLVHGKTSEIEHDSRGVFRGVPTPLKATRYHSLVGDATSLPSCLMVSARSLDDGEIMAVRHREYPISGLQFHPESILTEHGKQIIGNFLDMEATS